MKNLTYKEFISIACKDESFKKIQKHMQGSRKEPVFVTGPQNSFKTYLLAAMSAKLDKKLCIIVPDELRARELSRDFNEYNNTRTCIFRQREPNLIETYASGRESELQRLGNISLLARGEYDVFIITAASSLLKTIPPNKFFAWCKKLKTGDEISPDTLCEYLHSVGYERTSMVESAGQYSKRGDLVDIALPEQVKEPDGGEGIRISFFGDTVDSLKKFDLNTQRSSQMLERITVYPSRETIPDKDSSKEIIDTIKGQSKEDVSRFEKDIQNLEEGGCFLTADRYLSRIYQQPGCILDYVSETCCIIAMDEPGTVFKRAKAYLSDFYEKFSFLLEKQKVLPVSSDIHFTYEDIKNRFEKIPKTCYFSVIDSKIHRPKNALGIYIQSKETVSYKGREEDLVKEIAEREKEKVRTVLMIGDEEKRKRLSGFFSEKGITGIFAPFEIEDGFEYPGASTVFVGVRQIFFSSSRHKRKRKKGVSIDLFSELAPGELVVHEDHGIGRYKGICTLDSSGQKRDYIKIEYDKSDTLYIPTDNLIQIQKYVGSGGREPKLSRLGSAEWNRTKERAQNSVKELATDLIKLYAERMSRKGYAFSEDTVWQKEFEDQFEHEETGDQIRSIREIKEDMESDKVMDRLLCGDVGFGKTEVAFRAVFKCVTDGKQAAILVPTTVLARQHYLNLKQRVSEFPVSVGMLSRFASRSMIKNTKKELERGAVDVVIGTHRVLSDDVKFMDLGLLVIDEEQRFGVDHKEKLKELFPGADVLTLTATPIPRTLHMSLSGIRDISIIEDPPPDRMAVQTYVMEHDEDIIREAMLREISREGQVFYLFNSTTRIDEKARSIEKMLPGAKIVFAHGRMKESELEGIIESFINKEADVLVCTTIIESGTDMPNVNTMIIEKADTLGLAQLYQLRGRVGRSQRQAYCYITYRKDKILSEIAQKRLSAIRDYTELGSGFKIAMKDMEARGAGNILGARQHGNMDAVGYDLYRRMLEEEIKRRTGKEEKKEHFANVEFNVDAYIPKSFIPEQKQRMDVYRRIAQIKDINTYMDVLDEICDRFGEIPDRILTLSNISYIKNYGGYMGFDRIYTSGKSVVLSYREDFKPDMEAVAYILNMPEYKGKILFNAQKKPYMILRNGANPKEKAPEITGKFFKDIEKASEKGKESNQPRGKPRGF